MPSQVGDLDCFQPEELDTILMGVKDTLMRVDVSQQVDLATAMPRAAELFKERQEAHLAAVEKAGKEALVAAAAEEGARTTESGLVIKTLAEGSGDAPGPTATVRVHYTGWLPGGEVFDSSLKRGEPIEFKLSGVVPGWTEGIQLMRPGGKAKLTLPAELGYGDQGKSLIPPKATLIFEVELLAVVDAGDGAAGDGPGGSGDDDDDISI